MLKYSFERRTAMDRTLIVYSTKYGSTRQLADKLARILGPAAAVTPAEFCPQHREYESVVLGSPVYGEKVLPEIEDFVANHCGWLITKRVALFAAGLMPSTACLDGIRTALGGSVLWNGAFGGVLNPAALGEADLPALQQFATVTGVGIEYRDYRDDGVLADQALALRRALKNTRSLTKAALKKRIEEFLSAHNTCTLCTGHGNEVRATPIEYIYHDGALYFLSEGGEKFAHLLVNPFVSAAVYDAYQGFASLNGLQMTGTAELVDERSDTYRDVLAYKGLNSEALKRLPVGLHMVRMCIARCEFLSAVMRQDGYEARQTLEL
jgi:uncharacterized protein YhbP (UPF0306 family)